MTDICKHRHQGNPQSTAANKRVHKEIDRRRVLTFIVNNRTGYSKQIARDMGKPLNCISGRISELKRAELIEETGEVFEGCAEYKLKNNQLSLI